MTRNRSVALLTVLFGLMLSCRSGGPSSEHASLDASGEPLRSAFTQDAGKVRAIIIGSPT